MFTADPEIVRTLDFAGPLFWTAQGKVSLLEVLWSSSRQLGSDNWECNMPVSRKKFVEAWAKCLWFIRDCPGTQATFFFIASESFASTFPTPPPAPAYALAERCISFTRFCRHWTWSLRSSQGRCKSATPTAGTSVETGWGKLSHIQEIFSIRYLPMSQC